MKKKLLLVTLFAGMGSIILSGYVGGPALNHQNCTGAKASVTNCGGGGCHGTGTSTTVTITVDSGTTAVTHYKLGQTYKIKIHGTNTSSLPKFGFEFAAVSGIGSAQVQAGTFGALPASIFSDAWSGLNFIEQGSALTSPTAGTYDTSFQWTAPATNVGTLTLYCTINAVNGNGNADGSDISGNDSIKLLSWASLETATILDGIDISAFPNPSTSNFNLHLENAQPGAYNLHVFNMNGSTIATQTIEVNNASQSAVINTSNWSNGMYNVVVEKDGSRKTMLVVKQ